MEDFQLCKNDKGMEFVQFTEGPTKTRQGGLQSKKRDFQPRMFSVGGERFPVALFKQRAKTTKHAMATEAYNPLTITMKPTRKSNAEKKANGSLRHHNNCGSTRAGIHECARTTHIGRPIDDSNHLGESNLVHRDLAARNILVGYNSRVKVSDFGLMRQIYEDVNSSENSNKLPVKWMAPESLYQGIFTIKSDV
ncbi:unnamed protein product [Porites evermanni]|uniref:Protein kinase domain-containing protein n=1 Tax=Porites evermanni TaxID=104178 RepID=A0ABN8MA25_9CNID|nr:unnamed protein product [Porites evermanni]